MLALSWLIPALPLTGFIVLALFGGGLSPRRIAAVAVGAAGLAALAALSVGADFLLHPPSMGYFLLQIGPWIDAAGLHTDFALYLDPLAVTMMMVITVVGFLIHLYSAEHMAGDEGYRRYFAYLNLFVVAMLTLVLADNLLLLFLGWEGVGLCSYLLIGYWYREVANGRAARKAFIVTRVADAAFAVGLLLLFTQFGTLAIRPLMDQLPLHWAPGSPLALIAASLLMIGALGKSAQAPFQVWLPDAMAGPTPVSALIHAATMVTAGVYLIARTHALFILAPPVLAAVAVIGALTLLLAAGAAVTQRDIKRILAYSTISQIGYMFLALGVGAWSAAIFHFMTHAFFKALLFLSAGVVIQALDDEHDIFKMGGLRRALPSAYWGFLVGGASLAALPLVTSGFYSKDQILWSAWASPLGGHLLWAAGWIGALLTGLYTFRLIFTVFFGPVQTEVTRLPGLRVKIPLVVLDVLALTSGVLWLPPILGNVTLLPDFLHGTLPALKLHASGGVEWSLESLAIFASLGGIYLAYAMYLRRRPAGGPVTDLARLGYAGWGFDWLYERLLLRPYLRLAHSSRRDVIDAGYDGLAWLSRAAHGMLSAHQDGRVRRYATGMAAGTVLLIAVVALL
ncbi:MAG: NADH-quinone oxidoreductase subunit L [Gammaproteobacteria bacterium]|jgi:NADH-quinone oxidoreductase subunit L